MFGENKDIVKVGAEMNIPVEYSRWIEVDLGQLAENYRKVTDYLKEDNEGREVSVMAVVKSDGYGFGAVMAARTFLEAGAEYLAVTTIDEGIELRMNEIKAPILVFSSFVPGEAEAYYRYDLTPTIGTIEGLQSLLDTAYGREISCHIKINTGMNRMGLTVDELVKALQMINFQKIVKISGIYSHFATATDRRTDYCAEQLAVFDKACSVLDISGQTDYLAHLANSAGALRFPEARFNCVRLGSVLYGQAPVASGFGLELNSPFALKAKVANLQQITKGDAVGYGRDFVAKDDMTVAAVPVGYAEGFGVEPNARPETMRKAFQTMSKNVGKIALGRQGRGFWLGDDLLPVVGRVSMQITTVDVTGRPINVGDVVEVPVRKIAAGSRIPRVYIKDDEIVMVRDMLGLHE
ncbi:MAG: alanine racemase [Bacillota bacterium]|jgi:alanine racemase